MGERMSSLVWSPIRGFVALFIAAIVLAAAVADTFALLVATLFLNAGVLIFQTLGPGIKVLGPVIVAIVILTSGVLGFCRLANA
jgi:hypothetical protein